MTILFAFCTLFYYLSELLDLAGWDASRWGFFYGVHDIHRLLFLAPIIYAGFFFGRRAAIVITIIAVGICLPRALFISPFPDPILRPVLFMIIAGSLGYLTAIARNRSERCSQLEALLKSERDKLSKILDGVEEGVLIIGPDYRIRFMNPSMVRDFGEGVNSPCYKYLHNIDAPCDQICKLPSVIKGTVEKWEYNFPDGRTYQVLASPCVDSDGVVCQLTIIQKRHGAQKV